MYILSMGEESEEVIGAIHANQSKQEQQSKSKEVHHNKEDSETWFSIYNCNPADSPISFKTRHNRRSHDKHPRC